MVSKQVLIPLIDFSGLPTTFSQGMPVGVSGGGVTNYGEQQTVRKGQKQTYYCEICMIDLNR